MQKLYERLGLAGRVPPTSLTTAATAASSGPVDMANVDRLLVTLQLGALTGTVGIALQAATSTNASDFAALSTPIQATGFTAGNVEQQIEVMGITWPASKRYMRALITGTLSGANTALVSAIVQTEPGVQPATNASTVQTVVSS